MDKNKKKWIACPIEEQYFGDSLKLSRKERKLRSSKDRSKFKKTDHKKMQEASDLEQKERLIHKDLLRGRVLSINSQGAIVECEGKTITCILRGLLKKEKTQAKNLVVVGDFVLFEKTSENEGIIAHIEPRRTVLSRADNLSRRKEQLIAANIDQVIITSSVVSPPLKPSLIDRYIIAAKKGDMTPIVVINKIDLLEEGTEEKDLFDQFVADYKMAGVCVIPLSATTGEGIDSLKKIMQEKSSVFSGQSGSGKSSLINAVTGLKLEVGETVKNTKKGSHTTTTAKLVPLEQGGFCVDTPGIKSFGVWDLTIQEVQPYFPEIFETGRSCKYPDCTHLNEQNCAVLAKVEKGEISLIRYSSYATLLHTIKEDYLRR